MFEKINANPSDGSEPVNYRKAHGEAKHFWVLQEGGRRKVGRSSSFNGYFNDPANREKVEKATQSPAGFPAAKQVSAHLNTSLNKIAKEEKQPTIASSPTPVGFPAATQASAHLNTKLKKIAREETPPVTVSPPIPIPARPQKPTHQNRSSIGSSTQAIVNKNHVEKGSATPSTSTPPPKKPTHQNRSSIGSSTQAIVNKNHIEKKPVASSTPTPVKRGVNQLSSSTPPSPQVGLETRLKRGPLPPTPKKAPNASSSPPASSVPVSVNREKRSVTTPPVPINRKNTSASLEPSPSSVDSPSSPKRRFFPEPSPLKNGGKEPETKKPPIKMAQSIEFTDKVYKAEVVKIETGEKEKKRKDEPDGFQSIMPGLTIGRKESAQEKKVPINDHVRSQGLKKGDEVRLTEETALSLDKKVEAALNCSKRADSLRALIDLAQNFIAINNSDKMVQVYLASVLCSADSQMRSIEKEILANFYSYPFFHMSGFITDPAKAGIPAELENNISELTSKMIKCVELISLLHETLQKEDVSIKEIVNKGADTKTKIGTGIRLFMRGGEINKEPLVEALGFMRREFGPPFQSCVKDFSKALQSDEETSKRTFEEMERFFEALSHLTALYLEIVGYKCTNILQNNKTCCINMGKDNGYAQSEEVTVTQLFSSLSREINLYMGSLKDAHKNALALVELVKEQKIPFPFPCEQNAKNFQKLFIKFKECLVVVNEQKRKSQLVLSASSDKAF